MEPLTIRLLGYPEITAGQQPLSFRTRKVLALLVHLAVEGGMHSRESLTALLWPESAPKNAAVTLRGTLARLRKSLQPAGQVLITAGGQVGLDPDQPIDLDLAWLALGDAHRAREALLRAKVVAEEKGEGAYLWQVLAALGEVERASGAEAHAKKLREQAREIIADIAHHAGSEELRAAFLAQPEMGQVLADH